MIPVAGPVLIHQRKLAGFGLVGAPRHRDHDVRQPRRPVKAHRRISRIRIRGRQRDVRIRQPGEGDAQKNRILAEASGQNPEFFAFYRSLLASEASFKPGETRLVLSPESEFLRYFKDPFSVKNGDPTQE